MVTIFETVTKTDKPNYISIETSLDRIRSGASRELCEQIRSTPDKETRNTLKKRLPAVCYSGKFSSRKIEGLVEHSGFIAIDFDGFKTDTDLAQKRFELEVDYYTYACFLSPSGDGLKVIVKIPKDPLNHKRYFDALKEYYDCEHFDVACSDISRVCYESYDPDIHVNEESYVWDKMAEVKVQDHKKVSIPVTNSNKVVEYLLKWWNKEHGLVSGKRNHNIFVLAASLNEYGIPIEEAKSVCLQFEQPDFKEYEILTSVNSAYKNTDQFGTKQFDDNNKTDALQKMVSMNVPTEEIIKVIPEATEEIISAVKERFVDSVFWSIDSKGKVGFINHRYRDFLTDNGFYKYYPSGDPNFVFVRVIDNIMSDTSDNEIRDFVFEYLNNMDDMRVYDSYAGKTKLGKEEFLSLIPTISPMVIRDESDHCMLYYNNCALRITSDSVEQIPYPELGGYIWSRQRVDRKFQKVRYDDSEYRKFVHNIAGNDQERIRSVESSIGFLLHSFKPAGFCPAVILNDETISDQPEGGTGKGIFVSAISHIKKNVTLDGKGFSFQKSFQYQRISADTQIMTFQDIEKNFNFEKLFSVVTDGITVEKKNKQEIYIPFEESPKIIITTNYAVKGSGNSFERRKWELELAQHYSKSYTPADEFGHQLFSDWNDEEWMKFDNYMISCLQLYLKKGLIEAPFKNLKIRKLEADTSTEFREWCLGNEKKFSMSSDSSYVGQELLNDFCDQYPDYGPMGKIKITHRTFYKWLNSYSVYKFGAQYKESKGVMGKMITFPREIDQQVLIKFS